MLKTLGRVAKWPTFCVSSLASLYTGALRQFTTGRMGLSGLCRFINRLIVGADGFMLVYFHLWSWGIRVLLRFIVLRTDVWYAFVGFVVVVWNLFACMKLCVLESYCCMGRMTVVLPLLMLLSHCCFGA